MKKRLPEKLATLFACLCMMLLTTGAYAQSLTGSKTIPGDYPSIKTAIDSLNAKSVGTGGVTFNIAAGYAETLTSTLLLTATGTASNPIVFQKNGAGANPRITSYTGGTGTTSNTTADGIWALVGSDYVTIDGIDLVDTSANTTIATCMEYGYGLFKASATDGAQNNTIKNCTITLNTLNNDVWTVGHVGSCGIIIHNTTALVTNTPLTVTAESGASSFNKLYNNTIQSVNAGISLVGFAAPAPYMLGDTLNDVGGSVPSTGNTILNYGGLTGATQAATGIYTQNQWGVNISFNTINNNNGSGVNHASALRGIYMNTAAGASADVLDNTITIKGGGATAALTAIENAAGTTANNNTIRISNNTITGCTYSTATSGLFYGIWSNATTLSKLRISNNTINNNSTAATSGTFAAVYSSGNGIDSVFLDSNTISGVTFTAATTSLAFYPILNMGGTLAVTNVFITRNNIESVTYNGTGSGNAYLIYNNAPALRSFVSYNTFTNLTLNKTGNTAFIFWNYALATNGLRRIIGNSVAGAFSTTGSFGTLWFSYAASNTASTGAVEQDSLNDFSNITVAGSTTIAGWVNTEGNTSPTNKHLINNTFSNITGGLGAVTVITVGSGLNTVEGNAVSNVTGGGSVTGMVLQTAAPTATIRNNTIDNLVSTGASGIVIGMSKGVAGTTILWERNKIYNLSATQAGGSVMGIRISSAATSEQLVNNAIANLQAPASNAVSPYNSVIGLNLTSTTGTISVINNSIYLNATSTGTHFGSSALFANATINLTLRNNILINVSTPNGAGRTVAYRRSGASITSYNAASNNNIFYAGDSTLAMHTIYFDGASGIDTVMSAFKQRVGPARDADSYTENCVFLNTTGGTSDFLKPDPSVQTYIESGASSVPTVGIDCYGTIRAGFAGYTGTAILPDIGAVEGDFAAKPINYMKFDSAIAVQQLGIVPAGTSNNVILRVGVYVEKAYNALSATSFKLNMATTTLPSDISNAKIYYTGSNNTFTTEQLFGTTSAPGYSYYVSGNQVLNVGVNYFWIVYDISNAAALGNFVDAAVDSVVLSGSNYPLLTNDPAGNRQIFERLHGNYTIASGQTYSSITAAMSDLSLLGVSAPVTFFLGEVQYDEVSTGEIFPITLNPYGGSSPINTVTIVPSVSSRIVCVNQNPVFKFNGGSNYIIDGRVGGLGGFVSGNNLVIENTNNLGNTISFVNDADSNSLLYLDIQGAATSAAGTANAGVINIGTTTGTTGNDRNVIRYCDIHASSSGFPAVAISAIGTGTTTSAFNDNNTIEYCNIYDFYNSSVANAGIYVGANNGSWSIRKNHVYQTAKRYYTTVQVHRGMWITPNTADLTTAGGFAIDSNYIGGNAADGSGLYEMAGTTTATTGFQFVAMDISVGKGALTTVHGNTITNFNDSSTASSSIAFGAINLSGGKINCNGNLIGSRTQNGAITYTTYSTTSGGFMGIRAGAGLSGGAAATTDTINITNNTIGGIDLYGSSTTTAPEFFGMNPSSGAKVYIVNNLIGDTTLPNSINVLSPSSTSTTMQRVSGIFANSATAGHLYKIMNNTISNITNAYESKTTLASATRGIYVGPTVSGTDSVSGNLVKNITTASLVNNSGVSATLAGIVVDAASSTSQVVAGNTVHTLISTNASVADAMNIAGIVFNTSASGNNLVSGNLIHSLFTTASNPYVSITGLNFLAGNGIATNNMIRLGIDEFGDNITTGYSIKGIQKNTGSNRIFFNSVYIGGAGVIPYASGYAFNRAGAGVDSVYNNIFVNERNNAYPGAGHYAVSVVNTTNLNMNNNLFKADTIGYNGSTVCITLNNWKLNSGKDAASMSGDPGYLNPTGSSSTVDLHINAAVQTPVEGMGMPVYGTGTAIDFDGQTRGGLTPVDLGADAGNFIPGDFAAPVISYTALPNTVSTSDGILTATITDATGVYTAGFNMPRVYYKKGVAGSWNSDAGILTGGTANNGTWQFTISNTTLGGLTDNDSVFYFVVAQDITAYNNLGSFPSGADGSDVNSIDIMPVPSMYKILPSVGGVTYQVGDGNTFTSLTGSDGLFNFLNNAIVTGDITIQITSDIEESGTHGLNQLVEAGVGGYKVRIEPDAAILRTISGSVNIANSALIRLNGADRVYIDGSNPGGPDRYLRIMNRLGGNTINLMNDANMDTIANCIMEGMNTGQATVVFYGNATAGLGNDSNAIIGCVIRDTLGAVAPNVPNSAFYSTIGNNTYNTFKNNEVYNFAYNGVNVDGSGDNFWQIKDNTFYQIHAKNLQPIIITITSGSGHAVSGNSIGGSAPDRSGPAYTNSSNNGIAAISIGATVAATYPINIANNTISNFAVSGTGTFFGIYVQGGGVVNITGNIIGGGMNTYDTITTVGGFSTGVFLAGKPGGILTVDHNSISNMIHRAGDLVRTVGINVSSSVNMSVNIHHNTIRDITGNSTGTSTTTSSPRECGIIVTATPSTGLIISDNTISNIQNTNTGTAAYAPAGIIYTDASVNVASLQRNSIKNIGAVGTGTGVNAPVVHGIQIYAGSNCLVANNQISLGDSAMNESIVYGISDYTTGANNTYAYNSVFVNGETSTGGNNSFAFYRNSTGTFNLRNNILYNRRMINDPAYGFSYAIGLASATGITSANINHNLLLVPDTNNLVMMPGINTGWSGLNALYTATYNTNWAQTTSTVAAEQLFTDPSTGNLNIITTNPEAWYANGKGMAMANISGDFSDINTVRSTTIAGGATDIGADEFTPTGLPPLADADKNPAVGDSTSFFFGSRQVAKLNWVSGFPPSSVNVRYYSGVNPGNVAGGKTYMNAYWDIIPTGGSGYQAMVTLMNDTAVLGSVGSSASLEIARYSGTGLVWTSDNLTTVNAAAGTFTTGVSTGNLGIFTGTDGSNNPLPVKLTTFAATAQQGDVLVDWSTASETSNRGFEVERSLDGRSFEPVGFVKGAGNSSRTLNYAYTDKGAFAQTGSHVLYYRLKQVDMNGNSNYSQIAKVSMDSREVNGVSASPNPFNNELHLSFRSANEGSANVRILNIQGMVVAEQNKPVNSGMNRIELDGLSQLHTGLYFVQLTVNGETTVVKMMKD